MVERRRPSYFALGIAAAVTAPATGLTFAWATHRDEHWAEVWLPNLVAEAAGLFLAVFIVDALLLFERKRQEQKALEPLRDAAQLALAEAGERMTTFMVWTLAAATAREDAPTSASTLAATWPAQVEGANLADSAWLEQFADTLEDVAANLADVAHYRDALAPKQIADLTAVRGGVVFLAERLRACLATRPKNRRELAKQGCRLAAEQLRTVLQHHQALGAAELTSEMGWVTWPLVRGWFPDLRDGARSRIGPLDRMHRRRREPAL